MSSRISQKQSNFPKYVRNKSFLDFCLVNILLILEALKQMRQIWYYFFYMKNFENLVAVIKITLEHFQYPRVYMWKKITNL